MIHHSPFRLKLTQKLSRTRQRALSWLFRFLTHVQVSWFKNSFIYLFIKLYQVDLIHYQKTKPQEFNSFNDFFTRALKEGSRPLSKAPLISPVDGRVAAKGIIKKDSQLNAKGHHFTLPELVGSHKISNYFMGGSFSTLYLSPRDYHRIHMPMEGTLLTTIHIPGMLYSVSLKTAEKIPNLFAKNERLVALFETPKGKMAVIFVGAINVSSIETVWQGTVTPPYGKVIKEKNWETENLHYSKGEEVGRFNMGSTVIILVENRAFYFPTILRENEPIQMGQPLMIT